MPRWLRSLSLIVLAAAPPLYVVWADDPGALGARESEIQVLLQNNRLLRAEVNELGRQIEALRSDPRFLEKAAREELGWIQDGERVYRLSEAAPAE